MPAPITRPVSTIPPGGSPHIRDVAPPATPAPADPGASTFEPETRVERDYDAEWRNKMRRAFPGLSEADTRRVADAYLNVRSRQGFTHEMQLKPFEERFMGWLQRSMARPLRQYAGPSIKQWNALVAELAPTRPVMADLTLRYGKKQPGLMIADLVKTVEARAGV